MDLKFNGQKFRVRFTYQDQDGNTGPLARTNSHSKKISTFVDILLNEEKDERRWIGIAGSWSGKDSRDPFNKDMGRKIALGWALKQLPNRDLRRAIWDAYFDSHKEGSKVPPFQEV